MPTPNTETQVRNETPEWIASEIANAHIDAHEFPSAYSALRDAILSALRNERERAAKIAESHFNGDAHKQHGDRCDKAIARAIREEM